MKHIKKKYLFQFEGDEKIEPFGEKIKSFDPNLLSKARNRDVFITTEKGLVIKAFTHKHKNGVATIPIPDLTLVYFDSAYNLNKERKEVEVKLFSKLTSNKESFGEDATNEIYQFYGYASGCIIFLFTSIESFINHILPDDESYRVENSKNTIFYNKEQIQKYIQFDEKVKKVLPQLLNGANFFAHSSNNTQHIINLKNLRDELVHTKSATKFQYPAELIY